MLIDDLKWRYATKKFDSQKTIVDKDIEYLKEAVRLSVSSYGLQLYKVLIVTDKNIKETLREAAWNQPQLTDSSHIFIFCHKTEYDAKDVDHFLELRSKIQQVDNQILEKQGNRMKSTLSGLGAQEFAIWSSKQTYLALSNLLMAAAELRIDACPMEGFEREKFNEILGLVGTNYSVSVIAAMGYRSAEDKTQFAGKVRKDISDLFETL